MRIRKSPGSPSTSGSPSSKNKSSWPSWDARVDLRAQNEAFARELDVRALLALFLGVLLEHPRTDLLGDHALLAVALALALRGHDHVLVARDLQNLPEIQVADGHLQVHRHGVALRGLRLLRFPPEPPEPAPEELAEDVVPAEPTPAAATLLRVLLHALFAVPVVDAALLRIAQHLVRVADLGELIRGFLIPGVLVRVVLQRELAVGALDLIIRRAAGQAKRLVVVCRGRRVADERQRDQKEKREPRAERTPRRRSGAHRA
jgi:hypothetical protein